MATHSLAEQAGSPEAREDHFPADGLELGVFLEIDEDVAGGVEYEEPVAQNRHYLHPQRRAGAEVFFCTRILQEQVGRFILKSINC